MSTATPPRTTQDRYELQRATFDRHPGRRQGNQSGRSSATSERSFVTAISHNENESLPKSCFNASGERPGASKHADPEGHEGRANISAKIDRVETHPDVFFDHTVDVRPAVTHEVIRPHIHTVYEQRRTRSIHYHEHRTLIQPIVDPNPTILPEQHWAQDHKTGEIFKIPNELGRQLDEKYGRNNNGRVAADDGDIIKAMEKMGLETTAEGSEQEAPSDSRFDQAELDRRTNGEPT